MARKKGGIPSLRRHKALSQGVVRLNGRDFWCGKWPEGEPGPPAAVKAAYDRFVGEWLARGRTPPPAAEESQEQAREAANALPGAAVPAARPGAFTVAELLAGYLRHAREYYRHPDGEPTTEYDDIAMSLRPVAHLYGTLPAAELSPLKLQAVQGLMASGYQHPRHGPQAALCRTVVNQRTGRVKRAWKWGVSRELVPASVHQALLAVEGLRQGRSSARETEKVDPVPEADVARTLPHLPPHVAGLVRFLMLTGARCGEGCRLALAEIDRTGDVWLYRPARHKTAWRNKARTVAIGPKGQAVLLEFIRVRCGLCGAEGRPPAICWRDGLCGICSDMALEQGMQGPWPRIEAHAADEPLFSPIRQREERFAAMRAARKTRVQPSQQTRAKKNAKRQPGAAFAVSSVGHAIAKGCEKAGVTPWHAHQLRHLHGANARAVAGLDGVQAALGHSSVAMADHYSRLGVERASDVARRIG